MAGPARSSRSPSEARLGVTETCICWFKRDLRAADHAPLARAAASGRRVIALYVAEPGYWALPDTSGRQWAFLAESLAELRGALGRLGLPLTVRIGGAVEVLDGLRAAHDVRALYSHEETGNLWTYARDRAVGAWAREAGVVWTEIQGSAVERRSPGRDGWAKRREAFVRAPLAAVPGAVDAVPGIDPGAIPSAADLGMVPDPCPERQPGGRGHALRLLESFLEVRGQGYRSEMSTPVEGAHACSRLSPHLAAGTIGVREAAQALAARREALPKGGGGWAGSLASFSSRLAWRDHFVQKLEDDPRIEARAMHSALDDLRPREADAARIAAWRAGETGLPFVDACMRSLAATGWLNFRMRAMVQAVASYHLWLDWRPTALHSARMYADYEPGIHWSQTQMQSGVTGMNSVRIYNPVKQGHDQDPGGRFTRRWVPELAGVPDRFLQEPWLWEGAGRLRYPPPMVDVRAAAAEAKSRVHAARRGEAFRAEAEGIVARHGSRKPPRARARA